MNVGERKKKKKETPHLPNRNKNITFGKIVLPVPLFYTSHDRYLQTYCLSTPALSAYILPGPNHSECTTEECPSCAGWKNSNSRLVWKWHQTCSPNEQVGPQRGGHWRGWTLPFTDWWVLFVFAVQRWPLQSGFWIQWHCQGMSHSLSLHIASHD